MNSKNLIVKIAFFVALAAMLFSIVTLIRNIIIRAMIPMAVIQLVGTVAIAAICAYLMVSLKKLGDGEEEEQPEETHRFSDLHEVEEEDDRDEPLDEELFSHFDDRDVEDDDDDDPDDRGTAYDLSLFEEDFADFDKMDRQ